MDAMEMDPARNDQLVLVDAYGRQVGIASKERAHREGLLHRAFSLQFVRPGAQGLEFLLARRASGKYHCAGLWGNSCCSHPRAGEAPSDAFARRAWEELGARLISLEEVARFVYRAELDGGLVEFEYDQVMVGTCEEDLHPSLDEVDCLWWVPAEKLARLIATNSELFAPWALTVLPLVLAHVGGGDMTS